MSNKNINLLLIDDHQIVLDGYQILLEAEGFNVVGTSNNADDGVLAFKEHKPDVTLLDISMSGKSGLNCIQMLLDIDVDAKVIFSTMYDDVQLVVQAMKLGAKGFVTKAYPVETLCTAIQAVNDGGFYLSPKHAQAIAMLNDQCLNPGGEFESEHFQLLDQLNDKELSILKLVAIGLESKKIADEVKLSINTVANYRSRIMSKLKLKNSRELTVFAIQNGLIESGEETNTSL